MTAANSIHESLPYIDAEPTEKQRASALALLGAELHENQPTVDIALHHFSLLMEAEILRIERKEPLEAIDLSRYEEIESPSSGGINGDSTGKWREALTQAYTSHQYLSGRLNNLALLEKFGKNAWLVGNSQLEDILRGLEKELEETKTAIDGVVNERKAAQDAVGPEIEGLEEGWKKGVGRLLETEIAAEALRREILQMRRLTSK